MIEQIPPKSTSIAPSFCAPVVYVQPSYAELIKRFSVEIDTDFKYFPFVTVPLCKDVSREDRDVTFEYFRLHYPASTEEVLAGIARKGLRPALYEELLGFALKYPDEMLVVAALGSEMRMDHQSYYATLFHHEIGLYGVDHDWDANDRFLAVRT